MQLIFHFVIIFVCTLFNLTKARSSFQICESRSSVVYSNNIDIRNTGAKTRKEHSGCQCTITSDTHLDIVVKVFVLILHAETHKFPLEIQYEMNRRTKSVNTLHPFIGTDADEIFIARNSSNLKIKLEESSTNTTDVKFIIRIKTFNEIEDGINVSCLATGKRNDTSKNQDGDDENEILEYIEDLCSRSPQLVIMLAAVCVALLIIILIVSIILCCVMPRKQREQIKKIRHSMLLDSGDTTFTVNNADRIRPEMRLSDNPFKTTTNDNNVLEVPYPPEYFNNSYHYRTSNIYQNV